MSWKYPYDDFEWFSILENIWKFKPNMLHSAPSVYTDNLIPFCFGASSFASSSSSSSQKYNSGKKLRQILSKIF